MNKDERHSRWAHQAVEQAPPGWARELVDAQAPELLRASAEYVDSYAGEWRLCEKLYLNDITMSEWGGERSFRESEGVLGTGLYGNEAGTWRSQLVESVAHIVQEHCHALHRTVFADDEWLRVRGGLSSGQGVEDVDYGTAAKLGGVLRELLGRGGFSSRVFDAILIGTLYGSVGATVTWDREIGAPRLKVLPPMRLLVDPLADNGDPNTWRFCGFRSEVDRRECRRRYAGGRWNCDDAGAREWVEADTEREPLRLWEFYGGVVDDEGRPVEVVCSYLGEGDDVEGARLVRLHCGGGRYRRPLFLWQFSGWCGPFGVGLVGPQLDFLYSCSQVINLLIDNAKLGGNAMFRVSPGRAARELEEDPEFRPGRVFVGADDETPEAIRLGGVDVGGIHGVLAYLEGLLRDRMASAAIGVAGVGRTATEVSFLENQMRAPVDTRSVLFCEVFANPVCTAALQLLQVFGAPCAIQVRDAGGVERAVALGEDELRTGNYVAECTMGRPETMRIAQAQSIERVIPALIQLAPQLCAAGYGIDWGALVRVYLEKLNIPRGGEIVSRLPEGAACPAAPEGDAHGVEPARRDGLRVGNDAQMFASLLQGLGADASGRLNQG